MMILETDIGDKGFWLGSQPNLPVVVGVDSLKPTSAAEAWCTRGDIASLRKVFSDEVFKQLIDCMSVHFLTGLHNTAAGPVIPKLRVSSTGMAACLIEAAKAGKRLPGRLTSRGPSNFRPVLIRLLKSVGSQSAAFDVVHANGMVDVHRKSGAWKQEIRAAALAIKGSRANTRAGVGTVYFLAASGTNGPVKIGWTDQPTDKRVAQLQTGHPEQLKCFIEVPGGQVLERAIHRFLAPRRSNGGTEWFDVTVEQSRQLARLIADVRNDFEEG